MVHLTMRCYVGTCRWYAGYISGSVDIKSLRLSPCLCFHSYFALFFRLSRCLVHLTLMSFLHSLSISTLPTEWRWGEGGRDGGRRRRGGGGRKRRRKERIIMQSHKKLRLSTMTMIVEVCVCVCAFSVRTNSCCPLSPPLQFLLFFPSLPYILSSTLYRTDQTR